MKHAQADYINAGYRYEKATSADKARAVAEGIRKMLQDYCLLHLHTLMLMRLLMLQIMLTNLVVAIMLKTGLVLLYHWFVVYSVKSLLKNSFQFNQ